MTRKINTMNITFLQKAMKIFNVVRIKILTKFLIEEEKVLKPTLNHKRLQIAKVLLTKIKWSRKYHYKFQDTLQSISNKTE